MSPSDFQFRINEGDWQNFNYNGLNHVKVDAGYYSVYENEAYGWNTTYEGCAEVYINVGEEKHCYITNTEKSGEIIVTKFNDLDQDGVWDKDEPTLPDWEITLNGGESCEYEDYGDDLIDSKVTYLNGDYAEEWECEDTTISLTQVTDQDGMTTFTDLRSDSYLLDEILKDGWQQTGIYCDPLWEELPELSFNQLFVTQQDYSSDDEQDMTGVEVWLSPGDIRYCYIGNSENMIETTIESICRNNFPYLRFNVLPNFAITKVVLNWLTVTDNNASTPAGTLVSSTEYNVSDLEYDSDTNSYSKTVLWPGANDSAVNPDWPGWVLVNGIWTLDPLDFGGNLRPNANVTIEVNPTSSSDTAYPPSSPDCDPNPKNGAVLGASTTTLQSTGSNQILSLFVGMMLISFAVVFHQTRKS